MAIGIFVVDGDGDGDNDMKQEEGWRTLEYRANPRGAG